MQKIAVMIYGAPGSGKGTQANLLAGKLNLIHFDTGKFLESIYRDPRRQKEKLIQKEKKIFDAGGMNTPSFVLREVAKEVKMIRKAGWGVVFSGSPRTTYETERLVPLLEKLYGKKNVFVFVLQVGAEHSIRRNSTRYVCSFCRSPLLSAYYPSKKPTHCPSCGGKLYRRTLDKPGVIKVRLKVYKNLTEPTFEILKKRGYTLHKVDGRPEPYKVFTHIYGSIKKSLGGDVR